MDRHSHAQCGGVTTHVLNEEVEPVTVHQRDSVSQPEEERVGVFVSHMEDRGREMDQAQCGGVTTHGESC